MRGLARQVESPRLRPWQARTPYAVAGLVLVFMFVGAGLEVARRMRTGGSRQELTETAVRAFVDAFPKWAKANPERACPTSLAELTRWMTYVDTVDLWGSQYQWSCSRWHGYWRLGVWSLGEDQILGTPDDVWSDR